MFNPNVVTLARRVSLPKSIHETDPIDWLLICNNLQRTLRLPLVLTETYGGWTVVLKEVDGTLPTSKSRILLQLTLELLFRTPTVLSKLALHTSVSSTSMVENSMVCLSYHITIIIKGYLINSLLIFVIKIKYFSSSDLACFIRYAREYL